MVAGKGYLDRTGGPHDSIKYPLVYQGLRKLGYSKEKAARISNSGPEGWSKGGHNSHKGAHTHVNEGHVDPPRVG